MVPGAIGSATPDNIGCLGFDMVLPVADAVVGIVAGDFTAALVELGVEAIQ